MNPLLTDEIMIERIKTLGTAAAVAQMERGSGRTTGLAFRLLGSAITSPGTSKHMKDHANDRELANAVVHIADTLGLRNLFIRRDATGVYLLFTSPNAVPLSFRPTTNQRF